MFDVSDSWGTDEAAPASSDADLEALLQRVEIQGAPPPPAKKAAPPPKPAAAAAAATPSEPPVELGFVSPYPDAPALAEHFPSKVGGAPVWLLPERLPPAEMLTCGQCGRRLRFLLQLYCPRPEVDQAYHRSLSIFCCGGACLQHANAWRALRCNLPVTVPYYTENADGSWTASGREGLAALEQQYQQQPAAPSLPELLISVDLEGDWRGLVAYSDEEERAKAGRLLAAYEAAEGAVTMKDGSLLQQQGGSSSSATEALEKSTRPLSAREERASAADSDVDDEIMADDMDDDSLAEGWFAFQRRVGAHPEQALRYNRSANGQPLWASLRGRPPAGCPPKCENCGAPRTFEFQLMPQLVSSLEEAMAEAMVEAEGAAAVAAAAFDPRQLTDADSLDWGVLAVYTCSASCQTVKSSDAASCGYAVEYCWHQTGP